MNQILVSEKLYITPELKRNKRMYKIDFFISVFLVVILFSYYIYAEYDKNKNESISQEILSNLTFNPYTEFLFSALNSKSSFLLSECSFLNNILTLFLGFSIIAYLFEDITNSFILKFSLSFIV